MTRSLSKPYNVRLNASEESLLRSLEDTLDQTGIDYLTTWDQSQREGYRGHSGRKPQPRALLIRRALSHGLPLVSKELTSAALPLGNHDRSCGTDSPAP